MPYNTLKYNYYTISLSNTLNYSCEVVINNTTCNLNFGYNSRQNQRYFNITTSDGTTVLRNTLISLTTPILFNPYFSLLGNIDSSMYFRKKDANIPFDVLNWADNVELLVITLPPEQADAYLENKFYARFNQDLS